MPGQTEHTVELYCGPEKPFSKIASFLGYRTTTFDPNPDYQADVIASAADADPAQFPPAPLMIWMAPPNEGFDDKSGWDPSNFSPLTKSASLAEDALQHCLNLAYRMKATWWFLEAPKSYLRQLPLMRGFNKGYPSRNRYTIKPQDLDGPARKEKEIDVYTNAFWWVPATRALAMKGMPEGMVAPDSRRAPPFVYLDMLNQYDVYLRGRGDRI